MGRVVAVGEIAEAYPHVMVHGSGNCDGDGDAEDSVRQGEWIEVAVAEKDEAGGKAPE